MRYLIIGLGIYGSNLALDLTAMGHEVIGADVKPTLVEAIKEKISTAYILDSTDETALSMLPLTNVDIVIVAIGENFGASVKTVALLKQNGVPHIYARAIDPLHESILESFEIDRIVKPEQRAAADLVGEMSLGSRVDSMELDDSVKVLKFKAPDFLVGTPYSALNLDKDYNLHLIAATRPVQRRNVIGITRSEQRLLHLDTDEAIVVARGDILVTLGTAAAYRAISRAIEA